MKYECHFIVSHETATIKALLPATRESGSQPTTLFSITGVADQLQPAASALREVGEAMNPNRDSSAATR